MSPSGRMLDAASRPPPLLLRCMHILKILGHPSLPVPLTVASKAKIILDVYISAIMQCLFYDCDFIFTSCPLELP